jgi:N-acetylmuramoyl-L-alanine amidase
MVSSLFILANLLLVLHSPIDLSDKPISNYQVEAIAGDGVFSLLRRYKLAEHSCNIQAFYKMNKLNSSDYLKEGAHYTLPVFIYKYNGKSIRSTIGEDNWEKAVRIKAYNEKLKELEIRKTHYTESKLLWVPYNELHCADDGIVPEEFTASEVINKAPIVEKKETSVTKNRTETLFGKKYKHVEVVDNSLKNQVFYLVSGHGGPDPGTSYQGYSSRICEDEYAYDVVLRIARNLMQHGAQVEIIVQDDSDGIRDDKILKCDNDEKYSGNIRIARNQLARLADRTKVINDLYLSYKRKGYKEQKAVMIHVDSQSKNKRQDVYFYHYKPSKSGLALAENLQQTFKKKYDKYQKNRGYKGFVKDRGLFMLRNTLPTAVYIELANIKNTEDHARLLIKENRQALANWIFEGIIEK